MQAHEALGRMTGIALALALATAGCAGGQQPDPATADEAEEGAGGDPSAEEEEVMADLDSYLEDEGEEVEAEDSGAGDSGGEDVENGDDDRPRSTPKERTEQIHALIKAKRESVANCYKMARKDDPNLGKKIAVKILINPDGSLKGDPEIDEDRTDIASSDVRKCAIDVLKSIEYPPHPKGMETTFTYPFGF